MNSATNTVDDAEIAKFEAMAAEWWDPKGKFAPLHMMNPVRLDYITAQIAAEYGRDLTGEAPLAGLRILDIGCGGGLLSEPMARLGARVVGADAAERNIPVAQVHAEHSGLEIDYRHTTAEAMAEECEILQGVADWREMAARQLVYEMFIHEWTLGKRGKQGASRGPRTTAFGTTSLGRTRSASPNE